MTGKQAWRAIASQVFIDYFLYQNEIDTMAADFDLLEAILKDLEVDISSGKPVYKINAIYDKKSKVYELLQKRLDNSTDN